MPKPEPAFTLDELFSELRQRLDTTGDGWAMSELMEQFMPASRNTILIRLHQLKREGRLVVVKKRIMDITGRMQLVSAYRLKEPEESNVTEAAD